MQKLLQVGNIVEYHDADNGISYIFVVLKVNISSAIIYIYEHGRWFTDAVSAFSYGNEKILVE